MQFAPSHPRRPARENIVPMINVVFLLLIFFLMTAQIAPPLPFDATPPASDATDSASGPATLHVAADGTLAFGAARGDQAIKAATALADGPPLLIRADAALPAPQLARLLSRLGAAGVSEMSLVTEVRR